jgi:hypothetical protein
MELLDPDDSLNSGVAQDSGPSGLADNATVLEPACGEYSAALLFRNSEILF